VYSKVLVVSQGLVRDTNLHSRVGGILNTSDLFHFFSVLVFRFSTQCRMPAACVRKILQLL